MRRVGNGHLPCPATGILGDQPVPSPPTGVIHLVEPLVDDYTSGESIQRVATRRDGVLTYETATEHSDA